MFPRTIPRIPSPEACTRRLCRKLRAAQPKTGPALKSRGCHDRSCRPDTRYGSQPSCLSSRSLTVENRRFVGYRRAHGYRTASQDSAATSKLDGPSGTGMQRLAAALRFVLTQLETSVSAGTDSETPNVAAPSQLDGHTNPMSPPRRSSDGVARYAVEDCTVSPALPYTPATREPDVHASMTARTEVFKHRFLLTRERAAASPPSRIRVLKEPTTESTQHTECVGWMQHILVTYSQRAGRYRVSEAKN